MRRPRKMEDEGMADTSEQNESVICNNLSSIILLHSPVTVLICPAFEVKSGTQRLGACHAAREVFCQIFPRYNSLLLRSHLALGKRTTLRFASDVCPRRDIRRSNPFRPMLAWRVDSITIFGIQRILIIVDDRYGCGVVVWRIRCGDDSGNWCLNNFTRAR